MDARARQRPHHQPDQRRIDVAGEEVGRALVVRPEQEALDLGRLGAVQDAEQVERQGAAQLADEAVELVLRQLIGDAGLHQRATKGGDIGRVLRDRHRAGHAQEQHGGRFLGVRREHREVVLGADQLAMQALVGEGGAVQHQQRRVAGKAQRRLQPLGERGAGLRGDDRQRLQHPGGDAELGRVLAADVDDDLGRLGLQPHQRLQVALRHRQTENLQPSGRLGRVDPNQHRENQLRRSAPAAAADPWARGHAVAHTIGGAHNMLRQV